jgi:hypothetical protein
MFLLGKWAENVEQWDKRGNSRQERHHEAPFRAYYTSRMLESALEIGEHRAPGIGQKQQTEVRRHIIVIRGGGVEKGRGEKGGRARRTQIGEQVLLHKRPLQHEEEEGDIAVEEARNRGGTLGARMAGLCLFYQKSAPALAWRG